MKLTTNELKLFRDFILARKSFAAAEVSLGPNVWEPWMESTLDKLTDELYPQEFDVV